MYILIVVILINSECTFSLLERPIYGAADISGACFVDSK